jgi:nicotinamidase-related amidase
MHLFFPEKLRRLSRFPLRLLGKCLDAPQECIFAMGGKFVVTNFDPELTAVVLIDLQGSNMARPLAPHAAEDVLARAVSLADGLRAKGATIVFVRVIVNELLDLPVDEPFPKSAAAPAPGASELVEETRRQPADLVVTKRHWGAFYGTELEQQLLRRGIKTIILGGVATNFGVESTARAAFDRGYELVFAEDAMSGVSAEAHRFSVTNLFPRIGRVRTVEQILAAIG